MPSVALATYDKLPELASDEHPLLGALAALNIRAEPAVWSDPTVTWSAFDAVVIRSCWDYHLRYDEFFAWIDRVTSHGVPIFNSPHTLRWNSRKTYLHDLTIGGVRTVPTFWLEASGPRSRGARLATILADTGWERAVVKPIVSASAHETWQVSIDEARANASTHDDRLQTLIAHHGAMIQPFIPEVEADGEWSLQFFGGVFSHAVLKRATPGDFRVQREWGGTHESVTPTTHLLRQAHHALRSAPTEPVYARVDGVIVSEDLVVTELELLEPSLFLDAHPDAPARFAAAISRLPLGHFEP